MNLEGLNVQISASISDFNSKMNRVESRLGKLGGVAGKAGKAGAVALGAVATALGAVATAVGVTGVQYNALKEQSKIAWSSILGDEEEAIKTLERLQEMGKKTPFEFGELDKSAKLLEMAGFHGEELFGAMTKVGDAVSAIGGNGETLNGISMAIFQMMTKGKISAEEMNQMAERGIPAWQLVADAMGLSTKEVMKMSENGKLMAKDVVPMLVDGMGNKFAGAMEKQSKTFNGRMSTMKDSVKMLSGELAKPMFDGIKAGLEKIQPIIDTILGVVQNGGGLADIATALGVPQSTVDFVVNAFNTIKDTVMGVFNWYKNNVKALFSGDGNLGQSFTRIFNTIKEIALPILQDAIAFIKDIISQLKTFWEENGAQIIQAVKNMWSVIATIFEWIAPVLLFIITFIWDSIKGVISGALKIIMGLIKIFAGIFTGDFSKLWEGIKQLFFGALQFLWNLMNLLLIGRIFSAIKAFGLKAIEFIKIMWSKIKTGWSKPLDWIRGLVDNVFGAIKELFKIMKQHGESTFKAMWKIIKSIWQSAVNGIKTLVKWLWDGVKAIFNGIKTTASTVWNAIKSTALKIWGALKDGVMRVVNGWKNILSKTWDTIKSVATKVWDGLKNAVIKTIDFLKSSATDKFNALKDTAKNIFDKVKSLITKPIETAKDTVLKIIDTIKNAFSKMHIKIPKPKLPKVSVAMKKGVMGIPYPDFDVSWHKDGGIFNGASVIGVGEAGAEAVVPLQGHRMRPFAQEVASEMPDNGGGSGVTINVAELHVREEADIDRVAQKLHEKQQRALRQGGRG